NHVVPMGRDIGFVEKDLGLAHSCSGSRISTRKNRSIAGRRRRAIEENQPVRLRPFSAAIASACLAQAEDGRGVEKVRAQLEELFTKNKEAVDYIVNHAESMRGRLRGRGPLQETEGKPANAENARGFARGSSRGC